MLFQCRVPEKIQEAENVAFRISPQSRWRSFETPSLSAAEKIKTLQVGNSHGTWKGKIH